MEPKPRLSSSNPFIFADASLFTQIMVALAELKFMCVATFYVSMNFVPFIIPFLIYQAYALDS